MSKAACTRQLIIEQTAPVFNKQGYAGTSLHDLMAATGLTKGGIMVSKATGQSTALFTSLDHVEHLIETELAA